MSKLNEIKDSLLHLLFPHLCHGCGTDILSQRSCLCMRCMAGLPQTWFELFPGNPVERKFYGRLPVEHASATYYFTKESLLQHLVHRVKYKGDMALGIQMGILMGDALRVSGRFEVDGLVPLPLFPARERQRGYNQANLLCEGIAHHLKQPVLTDVIRRPQHTDTQTRKGRIERWRNMEGKFVLTNKAAIEDRHILLVDDVITTGASLEACGMELLKARGTLLSIACLCYSSR